MRISWKLFWSGKEIVARLEDDLRDAKEEIIDLKICRDKEAQAIQEKDLAVAESDRLREQSDGQKREIETLSDFLAELRNGMDELRRSLEISRDEAKRLEGDKQALHARIDALEKTFVSQRIGNGKLTEFIRRRHRPDNLPERLNGIDHVKFKRS